MFKWLGAKKDAVSLPTGSGLAGNIGKSLQRRLARGVDYNMKIVVKGDRNTGKSCLLNMLQGEKFSAEYLPTPQIQVANISWKYKATDDIVKVEVWDVVDKGISSSRPKSEGLKLNEGDSPQPDMPALDASFMDVYKGSHGVLMIFDVTKAWTFEYIQREIENVPTNLPVLIMANFRDRGEHRTVSADDVTYWIRGLDRTEDPEAGRILYAESSLMNGFGLMYVYRFFNLPYLMLQRAQLEKRLEINRNEMEASVEELQVTGYGTDEQDYERFCEALAKKRGRSKSISASEAQAAAYVPVKANTTGGIGSDDLKREASSPTPDSAATSPANSRPTTPDVGKEGAATKRSFFRRSSTGVGKKKDDGKIKGAPAWWGDVSKSDGTKPQEAVEDFVPDGELEAGFLSDVKSPPASDTEYPAEESSDDDDDAGNGLVAVAGSDVSDIELEPEDDGDGDDNEKPNTEVAVPEEDPETVEVEGVTEDATKVDDSSDEELPDGWIDPAESELRAKQREEEERILAEERAKKMKVLMEEKARREAQEAAEAKLRGEEEKPVAPAEVAEPVLAEEPKAEAPVKKKSSGLSFAAYAPPVSEPIVVAPPEDVEEIADDNDEDDKKKKKKKKKKQHKKRHPSSILYGHILLGQSLKWRCQYLFGNVQQSSNLP
eukprot:m.159460 g.159460  ORF g.159460 m.159460 type:complete len:661 (+) comp15152_c0_seq2:233-2215(+)